MNPVPRLRGAQGERTCETRDTGFDRIIVRDADVCKGRKTRAQPRKTNRRSRCVRACRCPSWIPWFGPNTCSKARAAGASAPSIVLPRRGTSRGSLPAPAPRDRTKAMPRRKSSVARQTTLRPLRRRATASWDAIAGAAIAEKDDRSFATSRRARSATRPTIRSICVCGSRTWFVRALRLVLLVVVHVVTPIAD